MSKFLWFINTCGIYMTWALLLNALSWPDVSFTACAVVGFPVFLFSYGFYRLKKKMIQDK